MKKYWIFIGLFLIGFIVSGFQPHDYFTWILEVFPSMIGLIVLTITFRKFRFTDLAYVLILLHCYILFVGGHYTYAEVPLFDWIRDSLHQSRNNYDKVGHFAQGFVPAVIVREIFIRKAIVKKGAWLSLLTICVCLSISVFYELLEWFAGHMEVKAVSFQDQDEAAIYKVKEWGIDNMKRIILPRKDTLCLEMISDYLEFKTSWHPIGF